MNGAGRSIEGREANPHLEYLFQGKQIFVPSMVGQSNIPRRGFVSGALLQNSIMIF